MLEVLLLEDVVVEDVMPLVTVGMMLVEWLSEPRTSNRAS
jgi:hypothetical protein